MREGLQKQLAQLNQERDEKIQAIVKDGNLVGKRTEEVNKLYDQKILDAKRDWSYEVLKVYQDLYSNIQAVTKDAFGTEISNANQRVENKTTKQKSDAFDNLTDTKNLEKRREYYDEILKIELDANKKLTAIKREELDKQQEFDEQEENNRHERVVDAKTTAAVMAEIAKYEEENGVPLVPDSADADWQKLEESLRDNLRNMKGELVDAYNAGKIDFKKFVGLIEDEQDAHNSKMNALQVKYKTESVKITNDELNEKKQAYNRYFQSVIATIRIQQDKISQSMSMQPERDKTWGVVNISKTKQNYETLISETQKTINKINEEKKKLYQNKGNMNAEDFLMRESELDAAEKAATQTLNDIGEKQKQIVAEFIQSLNTYIQAGVQSFSQIMNAVWDAQDVQFEKEQEYLDKLNEELDKKLDEQEEIVQKHKDAIESIEDELATARGDRRQHLIDQINAEMAAQRAAAAQQKKLEKEKEALERKQDALELKRKKAEYKRNMAQAIVNGAMAVTMAAVNNWPMPAIAMMALAAATTAAQIAIMASNKPYRVGGQLEGGLVKGKRHTQGGVPVGNTGIEVEGDEMIIRRESTMPNIDLLNYINKSQRKLDLGDFIDFYSSDKLKKNIISMSPKTRFAEGGILPTISNDYSFDDRLLSAFEDYSNRPVYVSVKEILNTSDSIKKVETLAGLNPSTI